MHPRCIPPPIIFIGGGGSPSGIGFLPGRRSAGQDGNGQQRTENKSQIEEVNADIAVVDEAADFHGDRRCTTPAGNSSRPMAPSMESGASLAAR